MESEDGLVALCVAPDAYGCSAVAALDACFGTIANENGAGECDGHGYASRDFVLWIGDARADVPYTLRITQSVHNECDSSTGWRSLDVKTEFYPGPRLYVFWHYDGWTCGITAHFVLEIVSVHRERPCPPALAPPFLPGPP